MTLRIAVPNKGMLSDTATQMLGEAGYVVRRDSKELIVFDPANDVEFFYLRPRDIATYVGSGALDVGITGRDLLLDSGSSATEIGGLDFGESTFRFAGPVGPVHRARRPQRPARRDQLHRPRQPLPEEAGRRCRNGGAGRRGRVGGPARGGGCGCRRRLHRHHPAPAGARDVRPGHPGVHRGADQRSGKDLPGLSTFHRRLQGVLVARQYVLMDYDLPADLVEAASAITPGLESPTVSPLRDTGWVAVRVMVPSAGTNQLMDELYELGARAILVSPIHAARI